MPASYIENTIRRGNLGRGIIYESKSLLVTETVYDIPQLSALLWSCDSHFQPAPVPVKVMYDCINRG